MCSMSKQNKLTVVYAAQQRAEGEGQVKGFHTKLLVQRAEPSLYVLSLHTPKERRCYPPVSMNWRALMKSY